VNSGDSNTIRDLAKDGFDVRIVFNPSITSTTVFYVFRTDAFAKPFIRQTEIAPTLEILGPESEEFVKNNQVIVKAYARRAATFGFWQYAAHATLS
jgi:phage major head subunit gpT-like protein